MTTSTKVHDWLREHGKGDLFECTWGEIRDALRAAGRTCPIADSKVAAAQALKEGDMENPYQAKLDYWREQSHAYTILVDGILYHLAQPIVAHYEDKRDGWDACVEYQKRLAHEAAAGGPCQ